ncbi:hypothetical protein HY634_00945 [Candidatus Uhrbacteria bacterium]|nr:hypothetical protein [Candidatus Uhrbacteria bacterium]
MIMHFFPEGRNFSGRERRAIALGAWGNQEMPPMQFGNRERMQGMQNMPQMNPYAQQRPRSSMDVRQMAGGFQNRIHGMQQQPFYPQFQGGMPQMPMMNHFMRGMRSPMAGAYMPQAMNMRYGHMNWSTRLRQYPSFYRGSLYGQNRMGPMGMPGAGMMPMAEMDPYSMQLMQERMHAFQAHREQLRMEMQMLGEWDRADADPVMIGRSSTRQRIRRAMEEGDRDSLTGDVVADWHRLGPAVYRMHRTMIKTAPYRVSVPEQQYRAHLSSLGRGGGRVQEGAQSSFVRSRGIDAGGLYSDNPIAQRHIEAMGGDRYLQTQNRLRNMYARDLQGWVDRNLSLYADDPAYPSLARAYDHARQMRPGDYGDLAIMRSQILAMRQRDERAKAQDRLRSEFLENKNATKIAIDPAGGLSSSPEERIVFSIPPGTPGYSGRSELRIAYKPYTELGVEQNEEWDLLRRLGIFVDKEKSDTSVYLTGDRNRPRVTRVNVYFKDSALSNYVRIYQPGYRETMPMPVIADRRGVAKPVWPPATPSTPPTPPPASV